MSLADYVDKARVSEMGPAVILRQWSFPMLSKFSRRQDADTLAWEYLDGDISPSRAEILSAMLIDKAAARQQFAEASVLHGMLFDYFKNAQAPETAEETSVPRRRKRGRTSAA